MDIIKAHLDNIATLYTTMCNKLTIYEFQTIKEKLDNNGVIFTKTFWNIVLVKFVKLYNIDLLKARIKYNTFFSENNFTLTQPLVTVILNPFVLEQLWRLLKDPPPRLKVLYKGVWKYEKLVLDKLFSPEPFNCLV